MIALAPLPRDRTDEVLHLELGPGQEDFVGAIAEMVRDPRASMDFHAIRRGDEAVGFFQIDPDFAWDVPQLLAGAWGLRGFLIGAQYQGRGIARAALRTLPAYLRETYPGLRRLWLTVNCRNVVARHTYLSAGWADEGELFPEGRSGPQHILHLECSPASAPTAQPRATAQAR